MPKALKKGFRSSLSLLHIHFFFNYKDYSDTIITECLSALKAAFDTESFPVTSHEKITRQKSHDLPGAGHGSMIQPETPTIFFGIVTQKITDKYSIANFSLQDQYNLKQTGDENMEHHQQGNVTLMYKRILITSFKINVWESVGRVNVYNR